MMTMMLYCAWTDAYNQAVNMAIDRAVNTPFSDGGIECVPGLWSINGLDQASNQP